VTEEKKKWDLCDSDTHLSVVVDREPADELPVLLAGDLELALELEQEELGGAQAREGGRKSGGTRRWLGGEREWEYHVGVVGGPGGFSKSQRVFRWWRWSA
jgi:hypothetical protein